MPHTFAFNPLDPERRRRITVRKQGGYLVDGNSMPGLCNRIRESFFPTYNAKYMCSKKRKRTQESPIEIGTRVDKEIQAACQHSSSFCETKTHPYTQKLLAAFRVWKWNLVECQVMIFDTALHLATAIDAIVRTDKGELLVLEIKTGFQDYYEKSSHFMEPPFDKQNNCAKHQHFLQLGTMCILLEKHHGWNCFDHSYIVRVDTRGVYRYELPLWVKNDRNALYERLLERRKLKKLHDFLT